MSCRRIVLLGSWWLVANILLSAVLGALMVAFPGFVRTYSGLIVPAYFVVSVAALCALARIIPILAPMAESSKPVGNLQLVTSLLIMIVAHVVGVFGIPFYLAGKWRIDAVWGGLFILPAIAGVVVLGLRAYWIIVLQRQVRHDSGSED